MWRDTQLHYCILPLDVARERGLKNYFTGKPCKRGHIFVRNKNDNSCLCVACREFHAKISLNWRSSNLDHVKEYDTRSKQENRERNLNTGKCYRDKNKKKRSYYQKTWVETNRGKVNASNSIRRAARLGRTFSDESEKIDLIYEESMIRRAAGEEVQVDHICPLQGELVSGLHCAANLRVIDSFENLSKKNKFTPYVEIFVDGQVVETYLSPYTNPDKELKS